jgi:hypothetical protein
MDWLLKTVVVWLSVDVIIIASAWYGTTTIKPLYPTWWKRVIVDDAPGDWII